MNAPELPRLYRLIADHRWPEATVRAVTHPEEVGFRHKGLAVLHSACYGGVAPPGVIRSLVEASPGGSATTEYRCKLGSIPLHAACYISRPDYVSILLEANGRTAAMTNNLGDDPIDMAIYPLSFPPLSSSEMSNEEISDLRARAWKVIRMLVEHRAQREASGPTSSLGRGGNFLNKCAGIAQCGRSSRRYVLRMAFVSDRHGFEIEARARDADGQLPLHVAISKVNLCGERAVDIVAIFLRAYPAAAREVDAQSGRLPLHVAIAYGKGWHEGVESIVDSYPPAITVRDPETGMYPFMMAAAAADGTFGRRRLLFSPEADNADNVREHADTVHGLLRACPELQRFHHPGDEESVRDESEEGGNGVLAME